MIWIFGSGSGNAKIGELPQIECGNCHATADRTAYVNYRYWHVWYIFSFLVSRQYLQVCHACGNVAPIEKFEVKQHYAGDGIPFIRKRGALVVIAIILALIGYGLLSDWSAGRKTDRLLLEPQPGDEYLAELGKIEKSGYSGSGIYGFMVLTGEEDGQYHFATSSQAGTKERRARSMRKNGEVEYSHDPEDPMLLSHEQLLDLRKKGLIIEAFRDDK